MTDNVTQNAEDLEDFFERMTESYITAIDKNLDAQSAFIERWTESVDAAMSEEQLEEQTESSIRAYEAWMDAANTSFDRIGDYMEGESVDAEEFRDIWLSAANQAFKETMSTTAFAAATGQNVDEMLQVRRQLDQAAEDTLHTLRFATAGDVQEVGERLVEMERRQHALEQEIEALADEQLEQLDTRTAEMEATLDSIDERAANLAGMEATLDSIDEQAANLDQLARLDRLDDMIERLNSLDQRTAQLDRLDDIFTELEGIDDRLDRLDDHADRLDDIESTLDDLHEAESEDEGEAEDTNGGEE